MSDSFRSDGKRGFDWDAHIDHGPAFRTENNHPSYITGPPRTVEFGGSQKNINKHQEKVNHNDKCLCKEHNFDDNVVMYEHIEQYPQFRCYCKFCLEMVVGAFSGQREEFNEMMKSKLLMVLELKGIKLPYKSKIKEFDAMVNIGLMTGNHDACKIANIMDEYNLKPNEDDSGIDSLNIEARNHFGWGEGMNYDWKKVLWKCRNCDNALYSATNPSWNCGEEGTYNWCRCNNCDTYFDKEGTIRGIKVRKEAGTDFLDRGVWN